MYNTDRVGERFDHRDMPDAGKYPSRTYDSFAAHVDSQMHDTDNVGDDVYAFHNAGGGLHPARSVQAHDEPKEMNRYDALAAEVAAESHEIENHDHAGLGPDCDEPKLLHKNSNSEDVAWEVEKVRAPPPPPPPPVVEEPERRAPVNIAGGRRHEDDPLLEKSEASSTDATFSSMMR